MNIFDPHISGSLSVSGSGEISNNLLVSGNLNVLGTINGSVSGNITSADTASFAPKYTLTSSFNTFTSSYTTGSFTGSFKGDGSNLYNIPASGVTGLELNKIVNGSASASVLSDGTFRVNGDAYIDGTLTAKEIHTSIVTSSVLYESGSTKFGDTVDDTHSFTGSVNIYGNQSISGTLSITGSIIPNGNFLYDLGSETNSFRDLYISTGSIRFHNPDGTEQGRITVDRSSGEISLLKTAGLTNIQKATISQGNINPNFLAAVSASNLFVHNKIVMPPSGTINGINLIAFSSSIATTDGNQNTRLNLIESTSGSLNTFTSSASGRLTSLESASSSIQGDFNSFTSSYNTVSGSINNRLGSLESFSGSYTGSFSGSFKGDGTNLFNIPASGVTGLNLTRIADGAATASISNTNGLRVNSNTEITGTLKLNKVNLGGNNIVDITLTDGGGKYFINGLKAPRLSFIKGFKYRFYYNNINTHPLLFSLTSDGEHNGGTGYTTGITTNSDPFYIEVDVTDATATTFYYWCDHHVGMGNSITVYSDFLHGQSSVNLTNVNTEMFATTGSNDFTNIQRISGSLIVIGSADVSGSLILNGQAIGTGKLDETTFQSYTSSNDSTNTTQNSRLTSIESATSSLNSFTSSIDNTIKNKLNTEAVITGSVQVLITGTTGYSTFSSSISTSVGSLSGSIATTTSGLSSSIDSLSSSVATTTSGLSSSVATTTSGLSSSVATTTSGLSSSIGSLSSSFSSTNDTQNVKLTSIETSTSSLNTFTSSIDTTIKNKLNTETVISGSVQVIITGTTGYSTFSSSISTSVGLLSSSVATTTSGLSSSIGSLSSSFSSTSDAQNNKITSIETSTSSLNSYTSSNITNINAIHTSTGSLNTFSSSILGSIEVTGSNLTVKGDLLVKGTTTQIDSTTVNIGDNIIQLNGTGATNAGIVVRDATAPNTISGSLLWDTTNDYWKAGIVGSEEKIILNTEYSTFSTSIDSRATSLQTSTSSLNTYTSSNNTNISAIHTSTGSLNTFTSSANTKFGVIETSTSSLNTFTSSLLTAIELTGSNLTVRGNFLVKGTTTNVNTTTLDVDNNLINLNGNGASFAGIRVKDTTGPNLISGSILWDSANDYWIAGQIGSEQRLVRETEFNNAVTRVGNVETSTGSLNSFTSSINTTIKTKLDTEGVLSGSIQVNHNATTNYVANQHIDHTAVSITAGSGLTGGGDISTTRTINVGAGNGITVNADDIAIDTSSATFTTGVKTKLNTEGVISGSAQVTGLSNAQLTNSSFHVGTTSISLGRASASQTLTGISIDGTSAYATQWGTGAGYANFSSTAISSGVGWVLGTTGNGYYAPVSLASVSSLLNLSGTNTGDETLARVNALAITTVGTITSGTWNGTAIGNAYLANSSFHVGTTSISLGRASASQTLTGVSIDGNAATVTNATFYRQFTVRDDRSDGGNYNLSGRATGLYAIESSGSNGPGSGYLSLIHVANGTDVAFQIAGGYTSDNMYFRGTSALQSGTGYSAWRTVIHSGNIGSQTVSNVSGTVAIANGGTAATDAATARTNLGLAIGTNVLAYRTFGTAANSATGDFAAFNATTYVGTTAIALNRASASQTLTGVSIDGNAATATSADTIDGVGFRNTGSNSSVAANTLDSNGMTYVTDVDGSSTNLTGNSTDGALYSQIYSSSWQHQIYGDYRTGIAYVRGKNNGTWASWKRVALSSSTTFSSVSTLTFTHNLGTANVTAQVFDSNGDMFFPSNIRVSSTQVIVTFASARSGRLVVTG